MTNQNHNHVEPPPVEALPQMLAEAADHLRRGIDELLAATVGLPPLAVCMIARGLAEEASQINDLIKNVAEVKARYAAQEAEAGYLDPSAN